MMLNCFSQCVHCREENETLIQWGFFCLLYVPVKREGSGFNPLVCMWGRSADPAVSHLGEGRLCYGAGINPVYAHATREVQPQHSPGQLLYVRRTFR